MNSDAEMPGGSTIIGEVAAPPFARLPSSTQLFIDRTLRFRFLAKNSTLAPYLEFLAALSELQYRVQKGLPEPRMAGPEAVARARARRMPPIDRNHFEMDAAFDETLAIFLHAAADLPSPPAAGDAIRRLSAANAITRETLLRHVLANSMPPETLAEHIIMASVAQIHFARCATRLAAGALVPVGNGACPTCGCAPSCTMVVGWPGAYGTRFCSCALCGTLWHYVRIACVLCGSTSGIGYQEIDAGSGTIKAETCDACGRYVKILYQTKDHAIEPIADDVASLALDLLMVRGRYARGTFNPFLSGY
ncbi:MAG: formate dehydrogenase accessory protein FdhE [Hyphomicrobiaceae bacterium]